MKRFRLADRADLAVFYEADAACFRAAGREDMLRLVSKDVFISHYSACPSIGFVCDGNAIGGILLDRDHAHLAVLPDYHGRWAILWKPALEWLFRMTPEAWGIVEADNRVCLEFMNRNGWTGVPAGDGRIVFRITPRTSRRN
ncbi:GNAT family N-acetyltransferase [Burkholderia arboris]|uniref:GNAT family N-acetyltransferase n=1 Tax=Burkholderia arboris TaxID=488730 RepID=UPI001CA46082|nr:GNAT family N-acetyltransferase [Burkholderia arboris]MBY8606290.1 GNAT family N-acetyltransferase [Burkholderia arboris]